MKHIKVGEEQVQDNQPIFEITIGVGGKNPVSNRINAMNMEEAKRIALDQSNITVVEVAK